MVFKNWVRTMTVVVIVTLLAGCGVTGARRGGFPDNVAGPLSGLRLMAPAAPGGGYDVTARTVAKAMEDAQIATDIEVFNLSGAGGTVGLQRLVNEKGTANLMMVMGLSLMGSACANKSRATVAETTPLARMLEESGAVFVPKTAPYRTLGELVHAWQADPRKITIGGGTPRGGTDYLLMTQLAVAVGIDPKVVNYVSYEGGGELLPALLGSKVSFGVSNYVELLDQVQAGQVRALAVTAGQRVRVLPEVPTAREQDVNLIFANWRAFVAPPGISAADRDKLLGALNRLHQSSQWQQAIERNGWTDAYLAGEEFAAFLTEQNQRIAGVLSTLGLSCSS